MAAGKVLGLLAVRKERGAMTSGACSSWAVRQPLCLFLGQLPPRVGNAELELNKLRD